jgi:hypothetical protein
VVENKCESHRLVVVSIRAVFHRRGLARLAIPLAVVLTAATFEVAASSAPLQGVSLAVDRYFEPACANETGRATRGCHRLRFRGAIPSRAANEYIAVLHQRCGTSGVGTSVVGTQSGEGGLWEATWGLAAGTFRARWRDNAGRIGTSDPVSYRAPVQFSLTKLSSFRQNVSVSGDQDMKGRVIELQRLVGGQWRLLRRTRLVADLGSYGTSASATFSVRRRGLVLRAYVPPKSAAPCYTATASDEWRSGPVSGAGLGARVIDRTLVCSTAMQGGIRMVTIDASSASGPDLIRHGPSLSVSSGFDHPPGFASASKTSFAVYPDRCTGSGALVSLEAGKLKGAAPGPFGRSFDCETPRRVYLRLRAVFFEPATLQASREPGYQTLFAQGQISTAAVAIRTPSGKPLLFATFSGAKARLFTARSCIEDTTDPPQRN